MFLKNEIASARCPARGRTRSRPRNDKQGFTLIELIMIILLTSILGLSGYHLMQFTIRNSFYLPNQVQADLVAAEAIEIIVEGDSEAKGLRFCKEVTTAKVAEIEVTNQDDETITYTLSGGSLYRDIDGAGDVMIPYFKAGDMTLSGVGGTLFTYYDTSDVLIAQPLNPAKRLTIRRINIDLIAQQGTGSSDTYEGYSEQNSSVKVSRYL